jgi:hypothetical protein
VESLREWLQRGPRMARVAGIEELESAAADAAAFAEFSIE